MVQSPDRKAVMRKRYNDIEENEDFPSNEDDFYEKKDSTYDDKDSSYEDSYNTSSTSGDVHIGQKRALEQMEDFQNIYGTDPEMNIDPMNMNTNDVQQPNDGDEFWKQSNDPSS